MGSQPERLGQGHGCGLSPQASADLEFLVEVGRGGPVRRQGPSRPEEARLVAQRGCVTVLLPHSPAQGGG